MRAARPDTSLGAAIATLWTPIFMGTSSIGRGARASPSTAGARRCQPAPPRRPGRHVALSPGTRYASPPRPPGSNPLTRGDDMAQLKIPLDAQRFEKGMRWKDYMAQMGDTRARTEENYAKSKLTGAGRRALASSRSGDQEPARAAARAQEVTASEVHDLVIDNAVVIDGLGGPARSGGAAIDGGRITAVGTDLGPARQRVDAGGLVLAPGIVDIHTHYDAQLTWDSFATPSTALGVTTVVIGNCGFTIAPCRPDDRDLTLRNLTHVEGMSLEALRAGVRWEFESYPEFLDALERRGLVPDVASFVGHSSVRTYFLGRDATRRAATDAEITEMRRIVLEAVRAGAVGFATSTLDQHNGENGIPMPSRLADDQEILALTGALGEAGRGVFMLTKGMTSTIPWLESIAAGSGRPVMIAAMFVDPGDPTRVFRELDEIGAARGRGCELWAQVGCFPLGMEFTLRHPYPLEAF